jgi:DedD protein
MAEERAEVKVNKKSLKRQLLGAFVLIVAIIVLFPVLFDGSGRIPVKKVTDIPPIIKSKSFELANIETPDLTWAENDFVVDSDTIVYEDEIEITLNKVPNSLSDENKDNKTEQKTTSTTKPSSVQTKSAQLKTGWSIQLGSFKNEENAQTLLSDLKASGFSAWIQHRAGSDNSSLSQVFAGPWVHESQARAINKELSDKFKVTGMVLRPR